MPPPTTTSSSKRRCWNHSSFSNLMSRLSRVCVSELKDLGWFFWHGWSRPHYNDAISSSSWWRWVGDLGVGWEYGLINENIKWCWGLVLAHTHWFVFSESKSSNNNIINITSSNKSSTNNNDEIQMPSFARSFSFVIDFVFHHQQPPTARLEWWSTLIRGVGSLGLIVLNWWTGWTNQRSYSRWWWWLNVIANDDDDGECIPTKTTTTNLQAVGL